MALTSERVLLKTPLNPTSGYGKDGILLAEGLEKAGAEVHLEPRNVQVPLTTLTAGMLTRPRPPHFETAVVHDYPGEIAFPPRMPQFANKIVGWTMYEFLGFGEDHEMTKDLEKRIAPLDLLLVYDEVSRTAMAEYYDPDNIQILQGGYDSEAWVPKGEEVGSRDWGGTFRFVMNGTMNRRKNPFAAITAFKQLKDEYGDQFDAELHMKTTSMALHPDMEKWCPGLKIHYETWSDKQIKNFYLKSHCLLAPSWGEGKNLPALEAQTTGCPAMVSDFGGHKQWANADYTYLLPGTIDEHAPGQGSFRVDEDVMAEMMWHVYNNRAEARLMGERAARAIPAQCDWAVVIERLRFILDRLEPKSRVVPS